MGERRRNPAAGAAVRSAPMEPDTPAATVTPTEEVADDELVEELLVEEISIDGMCGVY
jgi:mycofactocin precursor